MDIPSQVLLRYFVSETGAKGQVKLSKVTAALAILKLQHDSYLTSNITNEF